MIYHDSAITFFLHRIEGCNDGSWNSSSVPAALGKVGYSIAGVVITKPQSELTNGTLDKPAAIETMLNDKVIPTPIDDAIAGVEEIKFVIVKSLTGVWEAYWRWQQGEKVATCSVLETDSIGQEERLGFASGVLTGLTVAIVGLGSAGSKIASSLVRSGVGNFVLIDDDVLLPENLVRHDSDWYDVGQHKVDAVASRMMRINPTVEIKRRLHRLNGQESSTSAASALTAIGEADLIVDATANPAVFCLCADLARQTKTTLLWLGVYAGGIGGFVARTRPNKDAEPFVLRRAIDEALSNTAIEKGVEPMTNTQDYMAIDSVEQVYVATDADVSVLAGHATQMVLDSLLAREPSRYPYPAYSVGFTRSWIFDQPFQTIPIICTAPIDWSTEVSVDDKTRDDAMSFLFSVLDDGKADADT